MDKYEQLLKNWCDSLIRLQIRGYGAPHDGGFLCPACTAIHGRADNAFYPFLYLYKTTGDHRYYEAAELVFHWHSRMLTRERAAYNDLNNLWTGTTTFSTIGYYKALTKTGDVMAPELKAAVETRLSEAAAWVYENMRLPMKFSTNINYYAAAATVFADCGTYLHKPEYLAEGRKMIDYCMGYFAEDGLFIGEGFPHNEVTARGCRPVDMGYDLEESIPCLAEAAEVLNDEPLERKLAELMVKNLAFILPDGGIDNSFGSRNNKWTYWGSRTSDGCIAALMQLGKYAPVLYEAAYRNADLLLSCTKDGLLYGGRDYIRLGLKPCTHHSFCHAVALADALQEGLSEAQHNALGKQTLPCEQPGPALTHFPEIDTYRVRFGNFLADITAYDYRTYTFEKGAAHASGGMMTLLYHMERGPVIAGSTLDYQQTEPLNMQAPVLSLPHAPLIPRMVFSDENGLYQSCLERNVTMAAAQTEAGITISVTADNYTLEYRFTAEGLQIFARITGLDTGLKKDPAFILPIIENTLVPETQNRFTKRQIYWLAGGFAAEEYTILPDEKSEIRVTLKSE